MGEDKSIHSWSGQGSMSLKDRSRKNRKRKNKGGIVIAVLFLAIVIGASAFLIKKYKPTNEAMDLQEYYKTQKEDVVVILQDKIHEEMGKMIDGHVYLNYNTVVKYLNSRFYWDFNENLLIFTTPTEVIKADVGSNDYYVEKEKKTLSSPIIKTEGDQAAYVSLEFIELFSDVKASVYENPNRVVIQYQWGDVTVADARKNLKIRYRGGIKSPILTTVKKGETVTVFPSEEENGQANKYAKVMSVDGIIGYARVKDLKKTYTNTLKSEFKQPEYTNISKNKPINLVWHQVFNKSANSSLLSLLNKTKGVTTVAPTWFFLAGDDGSISSGATEEYVTSAHNYGVEVWAVVDDFNKRNASDETVNINEVLTYTSKREKLINELIANCIQYRIDGINVDFERIKRDTGVHYIQFIRELSIKCRKNGLVLSIDNYVPTSYSTYFRREEQGIVADYVITMAYDEHHASSDVSGSVASYGYVKQAIEDMNKLVPPEKSIFALPYYTRLWTEKENDGTVEVTSKSYSMPEAKRLLDQQGVKAVWDEETKQYYAEYKSGDTVNKMWLEDEKSIEEKVKLVAESKSAGVAGWKLGLESPEVWNIIQKYLN